MQSPEVADIERNSFSESPAKFKVVTCVAICGEDRRAARHCHAAAPAAVFDALARAALGRRD
jgi:hypothetical protein